MTKKEAFPHFNVEKWLILWGEEVNSMWETVFMVINQKITLIISIFNRLFWLIDAVLTE